MAWKKPREELSKLLDERMSSFDAKKKKMFVTIKGPGHERI